MVFYGMVFYAMLFSWYRKINGRPPFPANR